MNAASVKAKLKNFAQDTGLTFQEALTYYGLERTIYRISISDYSENFVLKGGIFLYTIFDRNYERATTDIDSITLEDITEFKEYHGLHISAVGYLDRTRVPVGIDIGFGDVVYPNAVKIDFPVMLDMDAPPPQSKK